MQKHPETVKAVAAFLISDGHYSVAENAFLYRIGGRLGLTERALFQVYWGHRILNVAEVDRDALQDDGVQMGLTWDW